ncbi:MAG: hypothetical protein IJI87_00470 [Mogibacterium sp.]|nr:hypothetical protein [Mogibacterium sp.]
MSRHDRDLKELARMLISISDLAQYALRVQSYDDCNTCGIIKECDYAPKVGEMVRINCPLWKSESEVTE